jgi:selenide,water dikinase
MTSDPVDHTRLTALASCAGCAGKAGADIVAQVVQHLSGSPDAPKDLLVGLSAPDDAAVYRLNDDQAAVLTIDFFGPLVDDPYDWGALAAANAMSDVYAMGGEVLLALNVAAFPEDMPVETIARVLRGGAEKVAEAGGIVAGGHTIRDAEPKYGLSVLGLVRPDAVFTKGGARPGDVLFLTKALGTGIVTTAAMRDAATPEHLDGAVASMTRLNRHASHIAREVSAHALTDVTGYSLLGHGCEMSRASGARLRIVAKAVPVLPGALDYAARGFTTGGAGRNRAHFAPHVRIDPGVSEAMSHLLWDPQTSGGLLMAVAPEKAPLAQQRFVAAGTEAWPIGEVVDGEGVEVG